MDSWILFPFRDRIPACVSLEQAAPEIALRVPSKVGWPLGAGQSVACILSYGGAASGTHPHSPESPHREGATCKARLDPIPQGLWLAQPGSGFLHLCPVTSGQGRDGEQGSRKRGCFQVRRILVAWGRADPSEAPPTAAPGRSRESGQGLWQMSSGPGRWTDAASVRETQCDRPADTRAEGPSGGRVSAGVGFTAWTLWPSTAHPQCPQPGRVHGGASPGVRRRGLRAGLRGQAGSVGMKC